MAYTYFSRNGEVLPTNQAVVSLSDIHYSYGFGVYETVRVTGGRSRFLEEHASRLMGSAKIIGLEHGFSPDFVMKSAEALINKNKAESCNLKILLIGASTPEKASLDMLCLNPRYPDRKLYKDGAHVVTKNLERSFPHAKTLNMLPSYLAHREARDTGAYDALLVNKNGYVTEATSANFFALRGQTIFTPPESEILLGVTRDKILEIARQHGYTIEEKDLKLTDLSDYDSLFLTSTSAKIMPITSVNENRWQISAELKELMKLFDKN